MITIIKQPYDCAFSKNKMVFETHSDMYFKTNPVYPSITLAYTSLPLSGEHFLINYRNPETKKIEEFRMVADNVYTYLDDRIPDSTFSGTSTEFMDLVFERMKNSNSISHFQLERVNNTTIKLTATQPIDDLIPEYTTNQAATRFTTTLEDVAINPEIRTGYIKKALVFVEREYLSGSFSIAATLDCYLNDESKSFLDVSGVIDSEIEANWDAYPIPGVNDDDAISPNIRRYYVQFVEYWDNETTLFTKNSPVLYAHWGGVSTDDELIADPVYLNSANFNFLTWWPSGKKLAIDQPDWLAWMNQSTDDQFTVKLTINHSAGTTNVDLTTIEIKQWESLVFKTGYTQLDLDALASGNHVNSWEFHIYNEGEAETVSPTFRYYPVRNQCLRRTILYLNSFGIPETFNTSGDWVETMKVSTDMASRSNYFSKNRLLPGEFVFSSSHRNTYKAVTGVMSNEESRRIQPLLNSVVSFVYEYQRWVPVLINTNSADVHPLNQFLVQIDLDILKANENNRASFHDVVPDMILNKACGSWTVSIENNGMQISTFGNMLVYNTSGTLVQTVVYSGGLYTLSSVTADGNYLLKVTLDGVEYKKWITYQRRMFSFYTTESGAFEFGITSSGLFQTLNVDWGDGSSEASQLYDSSGLIAVNKTYTVSGKKKVRCLKRCLEDVVAIRFANNSISDLEISMLPNLESIELWNALEGSLYLSHLSKLKVIDLQNSAITTLDIGCQRFLEQINLDTLSIPSSNLDELFKDLWLYREVYVNAVTININALGYTESALVTSILNGTGKYAGEGLVSDYGWTVNIT